MKRNYKKPAAIIIGLIVILALPVAFFGFMSGNVMSFADAPERTIAVVNEDLGSDRGEEQVEMGREVVSILSEDSSYEWTVTGRGAAENGLKANRYDAVVYIPSDFSEKVMSYDEANPEKAEFSYQVQSQKSGNMKETIIEEIDRATDRVNSRIATLYWSYVASEMDHIKKEFNAILDKESEFLDAMVAYYEPGANALADQMQRQREQVEQLRQTVGDVHQGHDERISSVETFSNELTSFMGHVADYKTFQLAQRSILEELQGVSIAKVQEAAAKQTEQFQQTLSELEENNAQLAAELEKVNEQIAVNKEKFDALEQIRQEKAAKQADEILAAQGTAIERYNDSIIGSLQKKIQEGAGSAVPEAGGPEGLPAKEELASAKETLEQQASKPTENQVPSFEEEKAGISELAASIEGLKEQIAAEQPESPVLAELDGAAGKLAGITEALNEKTAAFQGEGGSEAEAAKTASHLYNNLYKAYETLQNAYASARHTLDEYPSDTVAVVREIEKKEAGLLKHEGLSPERKKSLEELFAKSPNSKDLDALLTYHAALEQLGFALDQGVQREGALKDEVLKDEIIQTLTQDIAALGEEEMVAWETVGEGLPETSARVEEWNSSFAAIMAGYEKSVGIQHAELLQDLYGLEDQASAILAQIQNPGNAIPGGEPEPDGSAGQVASTQATIGSQLIMLSSTMSAVADRQDSIVSYAADLQGKADGFEQSTDVFSDRWQQNIEAIQAFNEDVRGFLDNTYVDGQENGYVFDHFINPLSVRGEAVAGENMEKVPPVILYVIMLISSLAIGYFGHRIKDGTPLLRTAMPALLGLISGLIISLYSVNMYVLNDHRAIEWTIFTILVVIAGSALVTAALDAGETIGWIAAIVLMAVYIAPLLILGVPEANIPDLLSPVYLSIKYDPVTLFDTGAAIAGIAAVLFLVAVYAVKRWKSSETAGEEEAYEA
ncbi:type VII secretion protein EsaA [Bhargavaea cecembensis DSE10]|uniref:Type VII secretion protein EsaA n=1 Tax=Bhargavaea cecembensis DSE10 TaxID=1235279 RepID=M7PBD4_9BACL|nr:type VII secretion protein EsaA [Bhargavaea cecembensis]EMR07764.1 type VII secretion protein EsaA [Bhargavaea cecembensis DSE10]